MIGNFDPDMLVGHNINGYDLDVLLHRMHDLQSVSWSKLGRLNQKTYVLCLVKSFNLSNLVDSMPYLKKTGINNKGESNYTKRKATIGRLVCDTYHAAKVKFFFASLMGGNTYRCV
jgi:DNA polymerase alpha subunit A